MTTKNPEIIAVLLVLGCATTQPGAASPPASPSGVTPCANVGRGPVMLAPDAPLETAVEAVACGGLLARSPVAADRWYVRRHQQFDERTSSLEAATMILAFTQEGASHVDMDLEAFGYIYSYARELSMSRVEKELQAYPDELSRSFRSRLRLAIEKLDARAGRLDQRDRAIFVDLLSRIHHEHLAHAKALAGFEHETTDLLRTVDESLGGESHENLSPLMREAEQLREVILIRCTERRSLQDCLDGPLIRPLSERLVRLALAVGDIPRAAAERDQLSEGADHTTLATHLDAELRRALSAPDGAVESGAVENGAVESGAVESGAVDTDEALTGLLAGEAWTASSTSLSWGPTPSASVGDAGSTQPAEAIRVHGVIKSYRSHAGGMEIVLEEGAPVVVPFAEARLLKYGEKLEAIVDHETRRGVILYAHHYASARIVQFRGTRLGGTRGVEMATHLAVAP